MRTRGYMQRLAVEIKAGNWLLAGVMAGFIGACLSVPCRAEEAFFDPAQVKMIIVGGIGGTGGQPAPSELDEKLVRQVDALPVDGFVFNLTHNGGYFPDFCVQREFPYAKMAPDVNRMKSFQFSNLQHRFVRINISAQLTADWFDDKAWGLIVENMKTASRAIKETEAEGVVLDDEQYGPQPFNYTAQAHRAEKDFASYQEQARKRGRQFMEALASERPGMKMLIFYANAQFGQNAKASLSACTFGLWPAFFDGLMDGDPKAEFFDAFENAYGYRSFEQFKKARDLIKIQGASLSQDPERYKRRIKAAYGLWLHRSDAGEGNLDQKDFTKNSHTPEELKHAIHYAMLMSDGYIWLYSFPWFQLPKEYLDAVKDARKPQALDFKPLVRPGENQPAAYICSAKGRTDCDDNVVFAPLKNAGYAELYDFPKKWRFRMDPENCGIQNQWFKVYQPQDWIDIEIGDWYEPQLKKTYLGYSWYRFEFDAPREWEGKKLLLAFGAVDEEAWIWINGAKAGEHAFGPDGWNSAFEIDATGKFLPGKKNALVVRVNNSAGVGGIWKSVKVFSK